MLRPRRLLVLVAVLGSIAAAVAAVRRRELERNTREFHARYG